MRMNAPMPTALPDLRSTKAWNRGSVLAAHSVSQRSYVSKSANGPYERYVHMR